MFFSSFTVKDWESCYWLPDLKLYLVVYVDDVKMAGTRENVQTRLVPVPARLDNGWPYACC